VNEVVLHDVVVVQLNSSQPAGLVRARAIAL
jgi:hypothetical protein